MATIADGATKASTTKRHAACDECRLRKVKCSGESDGCTRCLAEGIPCHYSDKKTMGRPRKRRRDSNSIQQASTNVNGPNDGENAADRLDDGPCPDLSNGNSLSASTAPSLHTTDDVVEFAAGLGLPHAIDPVLGSSNGWDTAHCSDLNGYKSAGSGIPANGGTNSRSDVGLPGQYFGIVPDMQKTATYDTSCSCLNQLYSTLQYFRSLPPPSFPASRDPLIRATNLGRTVNRCTLCPLDFPTALQTSMLLTTLLRLIVHGYADLVKQIQAQAAEGHKITYRVGDYSLENAHLHTGTLDCPMGFNLELEPEEWAIMAKKVVKQDLYGNSQIHECLVSVVEELEQRHRTWHLMQLPCSELDTPAAGRSNQPHELFLQLIRHMRVVIDALEL
ncbi:MAG: hypothetical protein Q9166_003694 [cf. Caloplaca sp. 2 TL-2023]